MGVGEKQTLSIQQNTGQEKIEVVVMTTDDNGLVLMVGNEVVEIYDYEAKSSAYGITEIVITIKGESVLTELSANSKKPK